MKVRIPKTVNAGTQLEVIDERIGKIFRRHGFPQYFFDKMLGPVEINEREGGNGIDNY